MRILAQFRKSIEDRKRNRIKARGKQRRRLNDEHVQCIKDFVQIYQPKAIKTSNIKARLVNNFPELNGIANSTLNRWMKIQCKLSYKRLEKKPLSSILPENIRKVFEAAYVFSELMNKGIELIYFDEFTINTRHLQFKGWTQRGRKGFVKLHKDWFAMSFVVALSEYKIYGIMGAEDAINTKTIKHYVEWMLVERNLCKEARKRSFALVWDNASINTSNEAVKFYLGSRIRVITLVPYTPALNPAEKLISAIKSQVIKNHEGGK